MRVSKGWLIVAAVYLLLVVLSILYVVYRMKYAPENSEFSGFGVVVLTLPWSVIFNTPGESSGVWLLFGVVNAVLICVFGGVMDYFDKSKRGRRS